MEKSTKGRNKKKMMMTRSDGKIVISDSYYDKMCEMTNKTHILMDEGFYPTKENLLKHKVAQNLEKYLPMLVYFSNDPFSPVSSSEEIFISLYHRKPKPGELEEKGFGNVKGNEGLPESEHVEYQELVDFANEIIGERVLIVSEKEYLELEKDKENAK